MQTLFELTEFHVSIIGKGSSEVFNITTSAGVTIKAKNGGQSRTAIAEGSTDVIALNAALHKAVCLLFNCQIAQLELRDYEVDGFSNACAALAQEYSERVFAARSAQ